MEIVMFLFTKTDAEFDIVIETKMSFGTGHLRQLI
jgi:hypothetical protein